MGNDERPRELGDDFDELAGDPGVDARAPEPDTPPKSDLDEDAQLREFLRDLRAQRNARMARDLLILASSMALLALTFVCGVSPKPSETNELRAEDLSVTTSAPASSTGPRTEPQKPVVDGSLDLADVDKAISAQRKEIERCLAAATSRDGSPPGTVTIAFLVSERGSVLDVADVGSTVSDRSTIRCVAQRMRALTLPPPHAGRAIVRYSF